MRIARSRVSRTAALAAAAGVFSWTAVGALYPEPARAHDSVIAATPEDGGTVEEFPRGIVLTFSGIPKDTFNTLAVSNTETNEVLFSQEPTLDGQDVSVTVPEDVNPGPGQYTVGFQITSSDGHATRGKTTFSVAGGDAEAGASASEENEQEENSSLLSGPLAWIVGALGVLAMAAVVVVAVARQRHFPDKE
ncbi:copper resistance CopC family protein [Corynebacterium oculi]|uniref:CopC domain-containing protein n=1 Tax=Corynebacterium oculi TaxID=1544416 RepID=A0A0N8W017_9CORY|nr:copper resistance protein CopC [Corynebacterium oculi]KQB85450.1 hypothetical protein Cocul_00596 [Corynebacterium oculi]